MESERFVSEKEPHSRTVSFDLLRAKRSQETDDVSPVEIGWRGVAEDPRKSFSLFRIHLIEPQAPVDGRRQVSVAEAPCGKIHDTTF